MNDKKKNEILNKNIKSLTNNIENVLLNISISDNTDNTDNNEIILVEIL
jgi:hypothetical protein